MNPRIYKKQAKRSVELLRSHSNSKHGAPQVYKADRWGHPQADWRDKNGIGIDGCPVFCRWSSTMDGREWDESCPRADWMDAHYWMVCVPEDYFDADIDKPWLPMTNKQRRERFSTSQIASGWKWRGGKAIRCSP